jgi:hypothetical protein
MSGEVPFMKRHLSLRAFNDVIIRNKSFGIDVSSDDYQYFKYVEIPKQSLRERLIELSTRPIYVSPMGAPLFLFNILGVTLKDLMDMDMQLIDRIETIMNELTKTMDK